LPAGQRLHWAAKVGFGQEREISKKRKTIPATFFIPLTLPRVSSVVQIGRRSDQHFREEIFPTPVR
jgi:hypothetical protein